MKKLTGLLVMLLAAVILLSSCGGAADSELLGALTKLAPEAKAMYDIIYGDALPHGDALNDGYCQISSASPYKSISEIRAGIEKVFSPEYSKILANTAFNGVSSDEGLIDAKFIERSGVLFVNPSVTADFAQAREFDISAAKVKKKNPYMAIILIPHADGDLEVTMQNVDGVWMIDSPMF